MPYYLCFDIERTKNNDAVIPATIARSLISRPRPAGRFLALPKTLVHGGLQAVDFPTPLRAGFGLPKTSVFG